MLKRKRKQIKPRPKLKLKLKQVRLFMFFMCELVLPLIEYSNKIYELTDAEAKAKADKAKAGNKKSEKSNDRFLRYIDEQLVHRR